MTRPGSCHPTNASTRRENRASVADVLRHTPGSALPGRSSKCDLPDLARNLLELAQNNGQDPYGLLNHQV